MTSCLHTMFMHIATRKCRALNVTLQVATPRAESAVYDCLMFSGCPSVRACVHVYVRRVDRTMEGDGRPVRECLLPVDFQFCTAPDRSHSHNNAAASGDKTRMRVIAASPSAEVRQYENTISGSPGHRRSTPIDSQVARCDFLSVFYSGRTQTITSRLCSPNILQKDTSSSAFDRRNDSATADGLYVINAWSVLRESICSSASISRNFVDVGTLRAIVSGTVRLASVVKVENPRRGNSIFSVGSPSHEGRAHQMLMRVNIRYHTIICLQQATLVNYFAHRCCRSVVYNRSCSVPPTVPVHLYELRGAGTLSANNQRSGPLLRNFSGCTISKVHV